MTAARNPLWAAEVAVKSTHVEVINPAANTNRFPFAVGAVASVGCGNRRMSV